MERQLLRIGRGDTTPVFFFFTGAPKGTIATFTYLKSACCTHLPNTIRMLYINITETMDQRRAVRIKFGDLLQYSMEFCMHYSSVVDRRIRLTCLHPCCHPIQIM